jgi:alkaline phosphatase D
VARHLGDAQDRDDPGMTLDRRSFLKLSAVGAGAAAGLHLGGPAFSAALGLDPAAVFQYGVASGDPLPDALVIWTRLTPDPTATPGSGLGAGTPVTWRVATDAGFTDVVQTGVVVTDPASDHTVKVDVTGLAPATRYWYDFAALGQTSTIGRATTAPAADATPSRLRFGLVSCSNYAAGYFGGYRYLAGRGDLDFVLHVGDYIYEYGDAQYGAFRPLDPPTEIVSLSDYRRRHALHKADPDLAALHAATAWITTIDDHEITNDAYRDGAQNHTPATEGDYATRRAAALRAYLEWMPIRVEPDPVTGEVVLYRTLRFGTLADLVVLDLRSYRDRQLQQPEPYANAGDPARTILGTEERAFLEAELDRAAPVAWKLVGNSVQIMRVNYPQAFYPVAPGVTRNVDAWDGYLVDRARVLAKVGENGARYDAVFLTGDIHSTWAADLPAVDGGASVATEFVCPSITSDNLNEILGLPPRSPVSLGFEAAIRALSPDVRLLEFDSHGASVVDVTAQRVQCDWFYVSDRQDPAATFTPAFSAQTLHSSKVVTPVAPLYAPVPVTDAPPPVIADAATPAVLGLTAAAVAAGAVALRHRGTSEGAPVAG